MTTTDQNRISSGVGSALGLVLGATVRATKVYVEQALGDERATGDGRLAILSELELVATALRLAELERDVFAQLTGALDTGPTLAVLGMLQDSLLLACQTTSARARCASARRSCATPACGASARFLDQGTS